MLSAHRLLREQLRAIVSGKEPQGHVVVSPREELDSLPDSYDALAAFGEKLAALPIRNDWLYVEPSDLAAIWAECDPARSQGCIGVLTPEQAARRVQAAWLYLRLHAGQTDRALLAPRQIPHVWAYVGATRGRMLITFLPAGHMEAFFREVTKANAMPPQDPELWRAHGMQLLGPPLTVA